MKAIVFSLAMSFLIMAVGTICLPRHEFPQGKGFHLSTWVLASALCAIAYYHFWGRTR
jgi:hypothetical protein